MSVPKSLVADVIYNIFFPQESLLCQTFPLVATTKPSNNPSGKSKDTASAPQPDQVDLFCIYNQICHHCVDFNQFSPSY